MADDPWAAFNPQSAPPPSGGDDPWAAFNPQGTAKTAVPLPDVGEPAIPSGPQISAGLPAANQAAQAVGESVGKATSNLPGSAYRFGESAVHAAFHPIETAQGIGQLAAGVAQYAGVPGEQYKPYADAAGKAIMERYGSFEKAKQTFENDPVGFAADVSSVISGGAGLARGVGVLPRTAARVAAPTTEALHDASQGHYRAMHGFGVELRPRVMSDALTNIETELRTEGYRDFNVPGTFAALREWRDMLNQSTHPTQDVEALRVMLNRTAGEPRERDAARRAIEEIDRTMANLTPRDAAINPQFATRVAGEARAARGDWAAFKHAETAENASNMAELRAAATGSGANIDNATRQKYLQILSNPKKRRGYSRAELDDMEALVRGSPVGNAARLVGKLAPTGVVSGALSSMLGHAVGHTIGVPAVGMASKLVSDALTRSQAQRISERIRLRSPEARRIGATPAPAQIPGFIGNVANRSRQLNLLDRAANPMANPYANGGSVDADEAAMSPETYANPFAKSLISGIAHIPQRAFEASEARRSGGDYDPGPVLDAAMLPMGGGAFGAPVRAGEMALGSGAVRYKQALRRGEITKPEYDAFMEALPRATPPGFNDKAAARAELNRSTRVINRYAARDQLRLAPSERAEWLDAFKRKQSAQQYLDSTQPIDLEP